MLLRFLIKQLSANRQVRFLKKRGLVISTVLRNGRQVYLYNYRDLFAEVIYRNDNPDEPAERLMLVSGLKNLTDHMKKENRVI